MSIVAISGVHWPDEWNSLAELWEGYRVTAKDGSGNFRVPLLFIAMLFPLMFAGGGKLSLDRVLLNLTGRSTDRGGRAADMTATGLALLVLGMTTVFVEGWWGFTLLIGAAICLGLPLMKNR